MKREPNYDAIEFEIDRMAETPPADVWVTRDGRAVRISAMSDSHLQNTIAWLRRNRETIVLHAVLPMWRYAEHAPDGAADAAEMGAEQLLEHTDDEEQLEQCVPQYRHLLREARKRKLQLDS